MLHFHEGPVLMMHHWLLEIGKRRKSPAPSRNQTWDLLVHNPMCYHLSYHLISRYTLLPHSQLAIRRHGSVAPEELFLSPIHFRRLLYSPCNSLVITNTKSKMTLVHKKNRWKSSFWGRLTQAWRAFPSEEGSPRKWNRARRWWPCRRRRPWRPPRPSPSGTHSLCSSLN